MCLFLPLHPTFITIFSIFTILFGAGPHGVWIPVITKQNLFFWFLISVTETCEFRSGYPDFFFFLTIMCSCVWNKEEELISFVSEPAVSLISSTEAAITMWTICLNIGLLFLLLTGIRLMAADGAYFYDSSLSKWKIQNTMNRSLFFCSNWYLTLCQITYFEFYCSIV